MKDAKKHIFSGTKKGLFSLISTVAIISSAAAGTNLVNANTNDSQKIVFSEELEWMKSHVSRSGETISIDFSNRFSSYLKDGAIRLESTSSSNVVTLSESDSTTITLAVKDFGDSVINVTATDDSGKEVTDQFHLRISRIGDLNGDGIVNPADVLLIYNVASGKGTVSDEQMKLLDLNGDGQVTNADASLLMASYVGKRPAVAADQNYFIQLSEVNDTPITNGDVYSIDEDMELQVTNGVLANDFDVEGNPLTVSLVSDTAHGSLDINPDGTFTYVPTANFNGSDQFTYKVNDGKIDSEVQTVTIDVESVNDVPVASAGSVEATEDEEATGTLSGNDVDNDSLTYLLVEDGKKGSVTINPTTGAFVYQPKANENGSDTFSFKVNDGTVDSDVVTVDVSVQAVNDAPTATDDSYSTIEDTNLEVVASTSLLLNDVDVDGDTLTVVKVSDPANGSLTLQADGTFTYIPHANFNGTDTFTYKVNDGIVDSEIQTVTIQVEAVNDAPVAKELSVEATEDEEATGTLSGNDVDNDSLTYLLVEDGKKGSVTINPTTGAFVYQPKANENGSDTFSFKVNDGTVDSEIVTVDVSISAVNDAPIAKGDAFSVLEDTNLEVSAGASILKNDLDVDGDPLTAVLVSGPANGSLTINSDGTFTYVPVANFNGTDSFTYKVNDGKLDSEVQTVTITVEAVNDAPVAKELSVEATEDEEATGTLSGNDVDNDSLTYILVEDGKKGSVTIDATTGAFAYMPKANENGSDTFSFKVNDGKLDSNVVTVHVTIADVNDAPAISNVSVQGKLEIGEKVTGHYTYTDVENDPEGASTYQWYRGTKENGSDKAAIAGATTIEYTISATDENSYLFFEVTPVAATGAQADQSFSSTGHNVKASVPELTLLPDPYRADPLAPVTEAELKGGTYISLSISGDSFKDIDSLTAADFVLNNAPVGLQIALPFPIDESTIGLLLDFDGTDFDVEIPDFSVSTKASATVKGNVITSNNMVIKPSPDAPTAYISEYLQGSSVNQSAIEIFYGADGGMVTGVELELHQWNLIMNKKEIIMIPMLPFYPNMTYHILNSAFYDAMDIMPITYFNEEAWITRQGFSTNALVLKKDGKVIDTVGDAFYNGPKPIFANGGTMVRNRGINDGLSLYNANQWTFYPADTFQYYGYHQK